MATIRLFASARDAAGTGRDSISAATVGEMLDEACRRYGEGFRGVLETSEIWVNGEPARAADAVADSDEVAVLPPVSGGSEALDGSRTRTRATTAPAVARRRQPVRTRPVGIGRSLADGLVGGYDETGPRVRLGLAWVVVLLASMALGPWPLAVLLGLIAGAAGLQTAAAWRHAGGRANRGIAGVTALALPLAAAAGTGALGLAAVIAACATVVGAAVSRRDRRRVWANAGLTLRCGYPVGLAAGSLLLIRHLELGAAISLVLLMCAYDVGDFLVGTEASTPLEGPVSGILAALVVAFALGVFEVPPFGLDSALVFGGLAAALFPLGQFAATELLPAADARAPALRRLDSLLLAAPLWTCALWRYLA